MSPLGLIPSDIGINAAAAICAIAFVSGTARGFSGFGSALIFMPLASEALFRAICYALIAAAVIFGLPALDGILR